MAKEYTKERVLAFLNDSKVSYDVQEHGAVHTMADVDSAGVQRKGIVLKNLFLKDGKGRKHFLVSVPEDVQIDFSVWMKFGDVVRIVEEHGNEVVRLDLSGQEV